MGEAKRRHNTGAPAPGPGKKGRGKAPLIAGVVVALVVIVIVVFYLTRAPQPGSDDLPSVPATADPFPADLDRYGVSIGEPDAPVVVREFADYQCPACARFAPAAEKLKEQFIDTGEVRLVFFDLPLQQHQNAMPAAQAARCASDQGEYWAMHKQLFDAQSEWSKSGSPVDVFARYAGDLGLDERRFRRCLNTELHRDAVEQSRRVAMQLRVTSTPTVLVDNIPLTSPGWGQLSAVVERELAKADQ
ncbi:DsbA family protein [Marinobacter salicampi]|uniref:DsbA family protein n=1 Tax=Marinobacter salicampi TaxID=435907 RepID=UPI0014088D67|nr:thioredoxin domain-containing protein [Marinobacter salicampi]